ncbi:MAG: squalene/phytoene synthase family protein, partial [Limnohabitans sp.]
MPQAKLNTHDILPGVSRSFALSIRLLPAALRESVGLAYLLARISDTVADTSGVAASQRLALLDRLQEAIASPGDSPELAPALQDFARQVPDPHEQALLLRGQDCLQALQSLSPADQAIVRDVLSAITEGQRWDLLTLGDGAQHIANDGLVCAAQTLQGLQTVLTAQQQGLLMRVGHLPCEILQGRGQL